MNAIEELLMSYDGYLAESYRHFREGYAASGRRLLNAAYGMLRNLRQLGVEHAELTEFAADWDRRSGADALCTDEGGKMMATHTIGDGLGMNVKAISYERVFSADMPAYENERLGVVVQVDGCTADEAFNRARQIVDAAHQAFKHLRQEMERLRLLEEDFISKIRRSAYQAADDAKIEGCVELEGAVDSLRYWVEFENLERYDDVRDRVDVAEQWMWSWNRAMTYHQCRNEDCDDDDEEPIEF